MVDIAAQVYAENALEQMGNWSRALAHAEAVLTGIKGAGQVLNEVQREIDAKRAELAELEKKTVADYVAKAEAKAPRRWPTRGQPLKPS